MSDPSKIDAFLDGQLTESQQREFLKSLDQNSDARAEFERQRAIDKSLRKIHREPNHVVDRILTTAKLTPVAAVSMSGDAKRPFRIGRSLAAAALIAFSVASVWYSWVATRPPPFYDVYKPQPWRSFETVFNDTLKNGFKPEWVCRNQAQFQRVFTKQLRQPLLLAALPPGVTAGGIAYSNTISTKTINVLGNVKGVPVMVFVDKAAAARSKPQPAPKSLNLYSREIDDLVLYEITPLSEPNILPFFYKP